MQCAWFFPVQYVNQALTGQEMGWSCNQFYVYVVDILYLQHMHVNHERTTVIV